MRRVTAPPSRAQTVALLRRSPAFQVLSAALCDDLAQGADWRFLMAGDHLVHAGDPPSGLWVVLHGRLRIEFASGHRAVAGTGMVGAKALITGEPADYSCFARRDTELAFFPSQLIKDIADRAPRLWQALAADTAHGRLTAEPTTRHITVLPADDGADIPEFVARLRDALAHLGAAFVIDRNTIDGALGMGTSDDDTDVWDDTDRDILAWFADKEASHDTILYVADPEWSPWTRRCLRQAESVLIVARSVSCPARTAAEDQLFAGNEGGDWLEKRLVLIQADAARPPHNTRDWLDHRRDVRQVHQVVLAAPETLRRLARLITGRGVGLVLGGGGARGTAHIGVVEALQEAGLPIDAAGGTSAGGGIASQVASDWDIPTMRKRTRTAFVDMAPFHAFSIPFHSMLHTDRVEAPAKYLAGNTLIEDLWRPFFCVSCDIASSERMVHSRGRLWRALRATTALPGVIPPVVFRKKLLVDGGIVDNLPVEPMRAITDGPIILVDVGAPQTGLVGDTMVELPSNLDIVVSRAHPMRDPFEVPNLANVVIATMTISDHARRDRQAADLVIRPDVQGYGLTNFEAQDELIALGYNATIDALNACDDDLLSRLGISRNQLPTTHREVPVWQSAQRAQNKRRTRRKRQSIALGVAGLAIGFTMHSTVLEELGAGLIALTVLFGVVLPWVKGRHQEAVP